MRSIMRDEDRAKTLEVIALEYQESKNPSLLAASFDRLHELIWKLSNKHIILSDADVASISLERLDYAMQMYKGDKASFITFYHSILFNALRKAYQDANRVKSKAIHYSNSLDTMIECGYDVESYYTQDNLDEMYEDAQLDLRERKYCQLILEGYNQSEIATMFGVSGAMVTHIKNKIKSKLSLSLNIAQ